MNRNHEGWHKEANRSRKRPVKMLSNHTAVNETIQYRTNQSAR